MFSKSSKLIISLLITTVLLSACSLSFNIDKEKPQFVDDKPMIEEVLDNKPAKKTAGLKKFKSYADLDLFLASNNKSSLREKETKVLEPVASINYFKDNPSDDFRESDILKQSSDFVYTIVRNQVMILRTGPEENLLLKKIDFNSTPQGLLLSGKKLIVYGYEEDLSKKEASDFYFIKIFDLSSPSEPSLINDYSFEGLINNIFIENNHLYLLTESEIKDQGSGRTLAKVLESDKLLASSCDGVEKCFAPDVFYFDSNYSKARFLNINVIDLEDAFSSLGGQVYLLSEDHRVFSSNASIFISYLETLNTSLLEFEAKREIIYPLLSELDKQKIDEFELLSDSILNPEEKRIKSSLILDAHLSSLSGVDKTLLEVDIKDLVETKKGNKDKQEKTIIYKIRIDKKNLDYYARTQVLGEVFNQYSLIQDGGYLYLATKSDKKLNSSGELRYYSNIYILDKSLTLVGKMENMASKEDVFGVRFLGNRAYLVSAEDNGSLFVVSLANKAEPVFAGSLKLAAKDSYLRPIDRNGEKFISFSRSEEDVMKEDSGGLRLSLLDFSDLKDPRELDSYLIGDAESDSIALFDRDSFFYSSNSKLVVFPLSFKENARLSFSGYIAFRLKADKLEMLGQVDHSAGGFYTQTENFLGRVYLDNSVKRSFVSNNLIHSFSNKFLLSREIAELREKSSLELTFHNDDLLVSSFESQNPLIDRSQEPLAPQDMPGFYDDHYFEDPDIEEPYNPMIPPLEPDLRETGGVGSDMAPLEAEINFIIPEPEIAEPFFDETFD